MNERSEGSFARRATDSLGRSFEWVSLLGQGGFGSVYLAKMHSPGGLSQQVAVKIMHQGLDPKSQAVQRLRDEAKLLASLRHPVILAALDLAEIEGRVAMITEYIEGADLSSCLSPHSGERIPPSTVLDVVEEVASALDAAFRQIAVVHRDIKPANIRVGRHGGVKLLDFGIARSGMEGREAQTASAMIVGTLRYLAPERFDLAQQPTPAADIFSLGCVLFEGICGEPLTGSASMPEVFRLSLVPEDWQRHVASRLAILSGARVPEGTTRLLQEMLSHDPKERPSASEVAKRAADLTARFSEHVRLNRWCRERHWEDERDNLDASPVFSSPQSWERETKTLHTKESTSDLSSSETVARLLSAPSAVESKGPKPKPARAVLAGGLAALTAAGGLSLLGLGALVLIAALYLPSDDPAQGHPPIEEGHPALQPAPLAPSEPEPVEPPVIGARPRPVPAQGSADPAPPEADAPEELSPEEVAPEEPVSEPVPEPPPAPSAPAPPDPAPDARSMVIIETERGAFDAVQINCRDGYRERRGLGEGVARFESVPDESCRAYFVRADRSWSWQVRPGDELRCVSRPVAGVSCAVIP